MKKHPYIAVPLKTCYLQSKRFASKRQIRKIHFSSRSSLPYYINHSDMLFAAANLWGRSISVIWIHRQRNRRRHSQSDWKVNHGLLHNISLHREKCVLKPCLTYWSRAKTAHRPLNTHTNTWHSLLTRLIRNVHRGNLGLWTQPPPFCIKVCHRCI